MLCMGSLSARVGGGKRGEDGFWYFGAEPFRTFFGVHHKIYHQFVECTFGIYR